MPAANPSKPSNQLTAFVIPTSHNVVIKELRNVGFDDGEILELNQVCAYFSYANRTVLGLGCSIDGDIIGLSPNNSEDPNDWSHS